MIKKTTIIVLVQITISLLNYQICYSQNLSELGVILPEEESFQFVEKHREGDAIEYVFQAIDRKDGITHRKKISILEYDYVIKRKLEMLKVMSQNFKSNGMSTRLEDSYSNNPKLFVEGDVSFGSGSETNVKIFMRFSSSGNKAYTIASGFRGADNYKLAKNLFLKFIESVNIEDQ